MTRGLALEHELETYLKHNHIAVHHSTKEEDNFKAIDLWVQGLPIQVTLGDWTSKLGLAKIRTKWDWTQFQSQNKAILVVFDMNTTNKLIMFKHMIKGLVSLRRAGLTTGILLVNAEGTKVLRGGR